MSRPLLTIHNNHTPACGQPPVVDSQASDDYIGYFQNSHGEQWIFRLNFDTGIATLHGGDADWDTEYTIVDGKPGDLILNREEQLWLQACLFAVRHQLKSGGKSY